MLHLHIVVSVNVNIFFDVFTVFQGNACFSVILCVFFLFYMFYAVLCILSKKKCIFTGYILQAVFLRIIFYIFTGSILSVIMSMIVGGQA